MISKICGFIVKRHITVLISMIILTVISLILLPFININYDMTKYLPENSLTKKGYRVMEDEFGEESTLKIMFKNLDSTSVTEVTEEIEQTENVSSVEYSDSEKYNSGDYKLFIVNISAGIYSDTAKNIVNALQDKFEKNYDVYFASEIIDAELSSIKYTILLALGLLIIILLFASSSWIDPLLYVIVIGVAVSLNMGTNIIFSDISYLTNSISAVLQLVLSIDYSIMLMNRYKKERVSSDKKTAMLTALKKGFSPISSSSLTTIAGMICMVFMSFTIGADMGLVLAKGIVFSLISVFTVMPPLILLFDNLIQKT